MISDCPASHNAAFGIYAYWGEGDTVRDCTASRNEYGGFYMGTNCTIRGCAASHNAGSGIYMLKNSTITDYTTYYNTGQGIRSSNGSTIRRPISLLKDYQLAKPDCRKDKNQCAGDLYDKITNSIPTDAPQTYIRLKISAEEPRKT